MPSLAGRLLVATPLLLDPSFHRTVVMVCAHDEHGAFGLVLNRPLELPVAEPLPLWAPRVSEPRAVFHGGPVDPVLAMALALREPGPEAAGWTSVGGAVGLLDLTIPPHEHSAAIEQLRVFTGHAGWGSGQLEAEMAEQAWWSVASTPDDVFTPRPDRLWHDVLRRQPGELALFADYPPDVSFN